MVKIFITLTVFSLIAYSRGKCVFCVGMFFHLFQSTEKIEY